MPDPGVAIAGVDGGGGHGQRHPGAGGNPPRSVWLRGSWVRAGWTTLLGIAIGRLGVEAIRAWLFGDPAHSSGVEDTFMLLLGGFGFLVGIGCFDYWWGYLSGSRTWVADDHSAHGAYTWRDYFKVNTDHKVIGIQYLCTTFIFFMIGGALAEGVRAEMATPGEQYFSPSTYNGLFSVHAALMIFLFIIPAFAGLANFVIPLMLGAQDMAFPRLNALSFWMLPVAGACMCSSFLVGAFDAGWTNYPSLAVHGPAGQTFWVMGVQFAGASSIATAVNFLVTIVTMRAPGMTFWRMPLLIWANLATSTLVVVATPFIAGAQLLVLFDRLFPTHFFDPAAGGNLIMYQHIFWFYSHPAVYIMMIPGFGIISEVIPTHSRKPIFGYRLIALSTVAIMVLSFSVWAHHMFIAGMAPWLRVPMMFTSALIAVPTGIKIFSWVATMWKGVVHLNTAMLFACGFLFCFTIGGLSGVFLAMLPVDINVSSSYFIVAHIHYVLFGGSVFTIYAGIYHWFPKMTGRMYDETLGKLHFWITFFAFNFTFMPMHYLGLQGEPRRVVDYPARFGTLNFFISVWAFVLGASTLIFLYNMINSWARGPIAPSNPWRALTLEWQVSSPPPVFNFDEMPQVVGSPYAFGIPNARHAIVTVHSPKPIATPLPAAVAIATPTQREAIMSSLTHLLVVANQTVASDALIAAVEARARTEPVRVTVICPQNDPRESWVIDERQVTRDTQRRLDTTLAELDAKGVLANGRVVATDPYTAVLDVVESSDPPSEIIISTLPHTRSGWARRDLIRRIRDRVDLPVTHVENDIAADRPTTPPV